MPAAEHMPRLRHLNETLFHGLDHARAVIREWAEDYNTCRPHSSIGYGLIRGVSRWTSRGLAGRRTMPSSKRAMGSPLESKLVPGSAKWKSGVGQPTVECQAIDLPASMCFTYLVDQSDSQSTFIGSLRVHSN